MRVLIALAIAALIALTLAHAAGATRRSEFYAISHKLLRVDAAHRPINPDGAEAVAFIDDQAMTIEDLHQRVRALEDER